MVLFEVVPDNRPVSGAGVRDMIEEEEDVGRRVDEIPAPSSDAGAVPEQAHRSGSQKAGDRGTSGRTPGWPLCRLRTSSLRAR